MNIPENIYSNENLNDESHSNFDSTYIELNEPSLVKRLAIVSASGVITVASIGIAYKLGLSDLLGQKITLQPTVVPEISDGFIKLNDGLREVSPVIAAGSIAMGGYFGIKGKISRQDYTINKLSKTEYSGLDEILQNKGDSSKKTLEKLLEKSKKWRKGTGIAALAVLLTGATSGLENEVTNGPLRPVNELIKLTSDNLKDNRLLLQSSSASFMDDSYVPLTSMEKFIKYAKTEGIKVVPFNKELPRIDGNAGLALSIPDQLFNQITGSNLKLNCKNAPAIVDNTVKGRIGSEVNVNSTSNFKIVKKIGGIAQMNRNIVILPNDVLKDCIDNGAETGYFGAVVSSNDQYKLNELNKDNPLLKQDSLIKESNFESNNRAFWEQNATPLLLQLMAYIGVFGAMAAAGERKSALLRNIREIGTLNALGNSMKNIKKIEFRRAIRETNKAAIIAAPAMPIVAGIFNMAEVGLKVGVGLRELAVGYSVTVLAKVLGSFRAVKKFKNNLDVAQAIKE